MSFWSLCARAAAALLLGVAGTALPATRSFSVEAEMSYWHPVLGGQSHVSSNALWVELAARAPQVRFFTDTSYRRVANTTDLGGALFVQVDADNCDRTPAADQVTVHLISERLGTVMDVTATETGASTGVFRTQPGLLAAANLVTTTDDTLWGVAADTCAENARAPVQVDPSGVVFDSNTQQPMAGARVSLIEVQGEGTTAQAQAAARVMASDGVSAALASVVTGPDGRYSFPWVQPGRYRLVVQTREGWTFPSRLAPAELQARTQTARHITVNGSYGQVFEVAQWSGDAVPDIPVDPLARVLRVQLSASRTTVEPGESVVFTATVRNAGESPLSALTLAGALPAGFVYVPGTLRRDGAATAEPEGGSRGPALRLTWARLEPGATTTFTYRALLKPSALQGDGVHRVQAQALQPAATLSNSASVKIDVQAGVFTDRAMVLGTVFADCNGNGVQDAGEPGAPGVRLLLNDGSSATTDAQGHYSFYGLKPRTHVLKVDALSLPEGAIMAAISQRHAGDGNSRFVDPRRGELHRADFALAGCTPALQEQLRLRGARARADRELDVSTHAEFNADGSVRAVGDRRALQASGLIGERAEAAKAVAAPGSASAPAGLPGIPKPTPAGEAVVDDGEPTLEQMATTLDPKLDFIDLREGQAVSALPLLIRTKGRAAAQTTLEVNGEFVAEQRIGHRVRNESAQIELREYVGVQMRPGANTLVLSERDGFGNVRGRRSVTVMAPGALAQLRISVPAGDAPSDGDSTVAVSVELLDANGLRVSDRTAVTLNSSLGQWDARDVPDLDPLTPGVQTFIEGGVARFALRAPQTAGVAQIEVRAGNVSARTQQRFAPALRPLVVSGLVEGVFNIKKPSASAVARGQDGFDAELSQHTVRDGQEKAGGRASVFAKGAVAGDTLLTLGYESDKDKRERLFRDTQPDAFYPVYGDDSLKGFDAQSTSRLYLRADRGRDSLLYGDFSTQTSTPVRQLGAYQRSLTGARVIHGGEQATVSAFAAYESTRRQVVEQRGNGTSGPYDLGTNAALANSERVEMIVRDRNQPALVLRSTPMQRFADYDYEPLTGRLLMRAPVPSLDADLNPVSLRITVEVDQGGPKFWVGGVDAQVKLNDSLEAGGSVARDWNPLEPFQLASVNASAKLAAATTLTVEVAHTNGGNAGGADLTKPNSGDAQRVELQHDGGDFKARAFAARADTGFANPSASLSAGRSEAGMKAELRLDERTRVVADALHSADLANNQRRDGVQLGLERSAEGGIKYEIGVRHVVANVSNGTPDAPREAVSTVRGKISSVIPALPMASAFIEGEQDLRELDKHMLAVGGDLQLPAGGRVYARHEFIKSLSGPYALDANTRRNATLVGIDAATPYQGRGFGEYRLRDGLSGREAEAAVGLRNQWQLAPGLRMNTSFERVATLQGNSNQSAAATAAVDYTRDSGFKGSARLEVRHSDTDSSMLATVGAAWKLGDDWTLLARGADAVQQNRNGQPDREQQRVQFGLAYRDGLSNRVNGLARYELKREIGMGSADGASAGDNRVVQIVSSHGDVQPMAGLVLTGQVAAKWVHETIDGLMVPSAARLIGGRVTKDLGERVDVGLAASLLAGAGSRQRSLGVEVGVRMHQNLWLSVGYNARGFKDRDLTADNYTQRGAFLRLRFKFDERTFASAD